MSLKVTAETTKVEKVVIEEVKTGKRTAVIDEPEYRRIGRIILAYVNGVAPHKGPRTLAAAKEFVAAMEYDAANTAVR